MSFQTKSIRAITCPDPAIPITATDVQLLTDKYNYNQDLLDEINKTKIDSDTQYRKGYYESEQYENLTMWHNRFLFIYYVLAIALILILVFSANTFLLTTYQTAGIAVGLMIYPHVIHFLFNIFKMMHTFIMEFVPKNIYNSI
jgi:hypothetical protein